MSIVWRWPLDVSAYLALGQHVEVGEHACPGCGRRLGGWSGYWRWVRGPGTRRLWIICAARTIDDIGGNQGPPLLAILAANPSVRGILFDRPHVVAGVKPVLMVKGLADRCTVVGGDFFVEVPHGADAYILKYVIHDWDDGRALAILARCRAAMSASATLLLIEQVLPERLRQARGYPGSSRGLADAGAGARRS